MKMNKKYGVSYQEWLIEQLKDHELAVAYLNAALEERLKGDEESQQIFLAALKNITEAQGGVEHLVGKASREFARNEKKFPIP